MWLRLFGVLNYLIADFSAFFAYFFLYLLLEVRIIIIMVTKVSKSKAREYILLL